MGEESVDLRLRSALPHGPNGWRGNRGRPSLGSPGARRAGGTQRKREIAAVD